MKTKRLKGPDTFDILRTKHLWERVLFSEIIKAENQVTSYKSAHLINQLIN